MNSLPIPSSEAQEQQAFLSSDQHPQQRQQQQKQQQFPHNGVATLRPPSTLTIAGPPNVPAPPSQQPPPQQQLLVPQRPLKSQLPNPIQHLAPQCVHIAPASMPMTLSQIQASIPPMVQHHPMPLSAPVSIKMLQQAHRAPTLLPIPSPFLHLQSHLQPTTAASVASLMNADKGVTQTPPIFRNRQLRSGKWTEEEEEYADLLIELFEKGQILEERNGCTLRSFLSRKLHCAPMRISKKYAGKGIGKMVFLSKTNYHHHQAQAAALMMGYGPPYSIVGGGSTGTTPTTATSAAMAASATRLSEAEAKFYKVAFADAVPPGAYLTPHPMLVAPSNTIKDNHTPHLHHTPPLLNAVNPIFPSTQHPSLLVSSGALTTPSMIPPVLNQPGVNSTPLMVQPPLLLSHPTPILLSGPPGSQPLLIQAPPGAYPQHLLEASSSQPTVALARNSTAAPPSATPLSLPTFSSLPPTPSSRAAGLIHSVVGAPDEAIAPPPSVAILAPLPGAGQTYVSQQTDIMTHHARNLHESYMNAIRSMNHHEGGIRPPPTTNTTTTTIEQQPPPVGVFVYPGQAGPKGAGMLGVQVQPEQPPLLEISPTHVDPNDIPDLLGGFDSVANTEGCAAYQSRHRAPPLTVTSSSSSSQQLQVEHQYSPPFTSRSFDDFHRFLGNLTPLASERNSITVAGSHAMPFPPDAPDLTSHNYQHHRRAPDVAMQVVATASEPMALYHPSQQQPQEGGGATWEATTTKWDPPLAAGAADRSAADVYNIFAQQSAFAASQHSAYTPQWLSNNSNNINATSSTKGGGTSGSSQNTKPIPGAPLRKPLFTPKHRQHHPRPGTTTSSVISDFSSAIASGQLLAARGTSNVVSEPSNTSDGGTDDTEDSPAGSSGSDSGDGDNDNSNDSDGAPSDASGGRKKMRVSYQKSSITTAGIVSRMSAATETDGNWDG